MGKELNVKILAGTLATIATTNMIGVTSLADEIENKNITLEVTNEDKEEDIIIEKDIVEDILKDEDVALDNKDEEKKEEEKDLHRKETEEEIAKAKAIENLSKASFSVKHNIVGSNEVSKEQFKSYLLDMEKKNGTKYKLTVSLDEFLTIAYEEAAAEGIRGDIVVAQAAHESGYFKFGGVLTASDNNFCGLGVTGDGSKLSFPSARIGLRAQVQHLKAYASKAPLNKALVDPRFNYVTRGIAPSLEELAGKWAIPGYDRSKYSSLQEAANNNASYGQRIYKLIESTKKYSGTPIENGSNSETKPESKPESITPEEKPENPTVIGSGEVINISSSLNIRKGPGTNYSVIGSLKNSQKVNIYGEEDEFYKIDYISNSKTAYGYVSKKYIKKFDNKPVEPSVPETNPSIPEVKPENKPETPSKKVGQVINISSRLNIRAGAGTNHKIIGTLSNSEKVEISGEESGWYKIKYGNITGYVSKNYLKVIEEAINTPSTGQENIKTVKVNGLLNIRSGAGTNYSIVGTLKNDSKVEVIGEEGNWYKINHNGKSAFVSKSYVR
ncbi:SH3 domain-containing protein [Clostridium massiliamazoniense]|uniref:SH3 domain-containing protein n=1 Tax=Clostridium massiliamazoniense TaxID=1347366 RepID=UPI0006D7BBA9|nr:SH3 domain-containing protein [Clostridium massiliamazoniense]